MNTNHDNSDKLKEKNPFKVPDNYFEGLTDHIMSQLPDPDREEISEPVTLITKLRPLLYMAAMFVGMGLFFKLLIGVPEKNTETKESLLVKTEIVGEDISLTQVNNEDEEYLEYVEEQYSSYLLKGELVFSE